MFASAPIPVITKYILGELEIYVSHNVCHGIDWQNWRQKLLNKLDLFEKHNKTTLSLFIQKTNTSNII